MSSGSGHPHGHEHAHGHEHEHEHEHEHGHAHEHEHEHEHGHEHALKAGELLRGAGKSKTLFLNAFAGISGDMTIAALLHLGVPLSVPEHVVAALGLQGCILERAHTRRSSILATKFDVHVTAPQPERTWQAIDSMIESAPLDAEVRELSRRVFRRLAEAEAEVHGMSLQSVHFHEVGAVDSIVDIVGVCAMIAWLGPDRVVCSPLPMGHGTVRARHGVLPLPAPATVLCLRGVPTYELDVEAETVTPTGAALAASLAHSFARWPNLAPEAVGWGAGAREFGDRPNLLRAVLGATLDDSSGPAVAGTHAVLEANIDDMTGELAGHVVAKLMQAGALDVAVIPTTAKKGRPGMLLSVIAGEERRDDVAHAILRETTTIGVRWHVVNRLERSRRVETVTTPFGEVPVKVSGGLGVASQAKPEFEVCVRLAEAAGVPVRDVITAALATWSARGNPPVGV